MSDWPAFAMRGVLSPVLTPFSADLSVDVPLLAAQCRWLAGADVGAAIYGTNSEGNSLSAAERFDVIAELVAHGVDATRLMPGTGGCAITEVAQLSAGAVRAGVGGVLVLPPFSYKGVSDDGLFAFYSEVIERVGDARLRLFLYHIPPVTQIPLSLALIERLLDRFGPLVAGIKDSGGDWSNTQALIERFAARGFAVFAGNENFLLRTMRAGGAGCISATANVNPQAIAALYRNWQAADAESAQAALDRIRTLFTRYPLIAAMKTAVAQASARPEWLRVRPPLVALADAQCATLLAELADAGFAMTVDYGAAAAA